MKWEYACIYSSSHGASAIADLNALGAAGWELVAVVHGWHYMKRPAPEPEVKAKAKPKAKAKAAKK